jgi:2-dehydro-3-deoxyphosphogluconate aldolase/(4S)-4-hydroxy-2-oxoglutarate aldolase
MTKTDILARIKAERVVALIRADGPDSLLECARALCAGGLTCIELTMTTPGAIELCARVTRELPEVLLGLGTVLDVETVHRGLAAGAKFMVTPVVKPDIIMACRKEDVPILGGAMTPTEIYASWEMGADVVKIFPAEFYGPAYIKSIKGPFPKVEVMPTGGVTPGTVAEFLRNGAFATAAGSSLVLPAALKAQDWAAITARAREFAAAAAFA